MSAGLIVVIAVIVLAAAVAAGLWWRHRTPEPLRGDWWPGFERDFHRWASRHPANRSRRPSRRDPR